MSPAQAALTVVAVFFVLPVLAVLVLLLFVRVPRSGAEPPAPGCVLCGGSGRVGIWRCRLCGTRHHGEGS